MVKVKVISTKAILSVAGIPCDFTTLVEGVISKNHSNFTTEFLNLGRGQDVVKYHTSAAETLLNYNKNRNCPLQTYQVLKYSVRALRVNRIAAQTCRSGFKSFALAAPDPRLHPRPPRYDMVLLDVVSEPDLHHHGTPSSCHWC